MNRNINARVTNIKTGIVHLAEVKDDKIVSILCNAEVTDSYRVGVTSGERFCKRCRTVELGSARGVYDYSKTEW